MITQYKWCEDSERVNPFSLNVALPLATDAPCALYQRNLRPVKLGVFVFTAYNIAPAAPDNTEHPTTLQLKQSSLFVVFCSSAVSALPLSICSLVGNTSGISMSAGFLAAEIRSEGFMPNKTRMSSISLPMFSFAWWQPKKRILNALEQKPTLHVCIEIQFKTKSFRHCKR